MKNIGKLTCRYRVTILRTQRTTIALKLKSENI